MKDVKEYTKAVENSKVHNLLWTGGWDSTFRLIQIVVLKKEEVQPYYIIDPDRKSVYYELRAMQEIKKRIFQNYPEAKNRIRPTFYVELESILNDEQIANSYKKINNKYPIGIQYKWLAQFAKQHNLKKFELALEKSWDPNSIMNKILSPVNIDHDTYHELKSDLKNNDDYALYHNFIFPIRELTKLDMLEISQNTGFYKIMLKTWFCHNPLSNGQPCGVCTPCTQSIKKGLGFRLPLYSKMRYHFRIFLSSEQMKKSYPRLHEFLRKIKKLFIK